MAEGQDLGVRRGRGQWKIRAGKAEVWMFPGTTLGKGSHDLVFVAGT